MVTKCVCGERASYRSHFKKHLCDDCSRKMWSKEGVPYYG